VEGKISGADPVPFLPRGSGMGKKSVSGSGMNNPNHISESLETFFWVSKLKFFDADPQNWVKCASENHKQCRQAYQVSGK
jgi:hypothetical protein